MVYCFVGSNETMWNAAIAHRRETGEYIVHYRTYDILRLLFGGSLYAMTDPFFALMVMHNLSSDYVVWDKSASIDFLAPARLGLKGLDQVNY